MGDFSGAVEFSGLEGTCGSVVGEGKSSNSFEKVVNNFSFVNGAVVEFGGVCVDGLGFLLGFLLADFFDEGVDFGDFFGEDDAFGVEVFGGVVQNVEEVEVVDGFGERVYQ